MATRKTTQKAAPVVKAPTNPNRKFFVVEVERDGSISSYSSPEEFETREAAEADAVRKAEDDINDNVYFVAEVVSFTTRPKAVIADVRTTDPVV